MPVPHEQELRRALGEELKSNPAFDSVARLIDTLLDEGGCPWDRARTLKDCPKYLKGELDEVLVAIESGDDDNLEEELGDILFMVAFTAKVAEKESRMTVRGMFERILNKMVYRHPHVFGGEMEASTPGEVFDNWQILKEKEKDGGDGNSTE
jgi:uncharacterized protein YabN with tetrapyrrole methylase and pyrophosphatase domain